MYTRQRIRALGRTDLKLVGRDRFLLLMVLLIVYLALIVRYGLPWLNTYLLDNGILPNASFAYSLADLYPMIVAFMGVFQGSLIAGTIVGFMLIDEKEDHTLKAILVTPVPFQQYIGYRIAIPSVLAFVTVVGLVLFINQALIPLGHLLLIAAGASLTGSLATLFYAIFAANKVQGFAMAKFVGIFGWLILIAWFIDEPWQWLFGLFPPYWISKAYWMVFAGESFWWLALLAGIVTQLALLAVMVRRFHAVAYR